MQSLGLWIFDPVVHRDLLDDFFAGLVIDVDFARGTTKAVPRVVSLVDLGRPLKARYSWEQGKLASSLR